MTDRHYARTYSDISRGYMPTADPVHECGLLCSVQRLWNSRGYRHRAGDSIMIYENTHSRTLRVYLEVATRVWCVL